MATKYWRAGAVNWSLSTTWSSTWPSISPTAAPTAFDDVVFETNANITTNTGVCRTMTVNSTVNMSGTGVITISGSIYVYGSLSQSTSAGALTMTGAIAAEIYQAAGQLHKLTINKVSGNVTLLSALYVTVISNASILTFLAGNFYFNSYTVICSLFASSTGTRAWSQTGDMYVSGTSGTVFNVVAGASLYDRTGTVYIQGAAATVTVALGAFAYNTAWNISLGSPWNYTLSGAAYNFTLNGFASGAVTVFNDFAGAEQNCPNLVVTFSNSSAGQVREFSWAGTLSGLTIPALFANVTYNINYARFTGATPLNFSGAGYTYNLYDVTWTTGQTALTGASSTYYFANVSWTSGILYINALGSQFYFGIVRNTLSTGSMVFIGASTYHINDGSNPADIQLTGTLTFSGGTIAFEDQGNTTIYCKQFVSAVTTARVINWNTFFDSFIVCRGVDGTLRISNSTGLTTNTTDSMNYSGQGSGSNTCGFKITGTAPVTGSLFGTMTIANGAFNVYVGEGASTSITSGTVRNLVLIDNVTITTASVVTVLQSVYAWGGSLTTQNLTGLTLNMTGIDYYTYDFNYRVSVVNFTTGGHWTLANVYATTGNFTGSTPNYDYVYVNIVGVLTYGGNQGNHNFTYARAASATFNGTNFGNCTYTDFQLTGAHTIGGADTTHNLNYVRAASGSYTGTGTFNYNDVGFTGLLTANGGGSTQHLTLVTAGSITLNGAIVNYDLTNCTATTTITLSGNSYYTLTYVRTGNLVLSGSGAQYYSYDVVATNTTSGVNLTLGNLVLYQDLTAAAFLCTGSSTRSIAFGNYNIKTSGVGVWNLTTVTGLTTSTSGGGAYLQGSGTVSLGTLDQNNAINITLLSVAAFTTGTMRNFVNSLGYLDPAYYPTGTPTLTIYGNVILSNNPGFAIGQTDYSPYWSAIPIIMGRPDGSTQTLQTATNTPWGPALLTLGTLTINQPNTIQSTYPTGATTFVHTNGTLDLTNYALNVKTSYTVTNNANAKAIVFGANDIIIDATTGTPWSATDSNYLTCTGTGRVTIRGGAVINGSTSRKYTDQPNFYLQENAAAYTLTSSFTTKDLTINNYTPTASFIFYIGGSLAWTYSATGIPSTVSFNFNSAPAANISFNSTSFTVPAVTINDKTLTATSAISFSTMTVNSGFNSNGYTMNVSTLLTVNSAGSITCGASTWNIIGGGASTGWNMVSGATISAGTSNIVFNGSGEKYASFGSSQTVNTITNSAPTPYTGWGGSFTGAGYVTAPNSATLDLGTVDFTMEAWVYATTATGIRRIAAKQNAGTNWILRLNATTNTVGFEINGVTVITSATGLSVGTWYHVAIVYSRSTPINGMVVFINGNYDTSSTYFGTPGAISAVTSIGAYAAVSSEQFVGYISNYRFVKGVAVYTGNFTVPTEPLSRIQSASTNIAQLTGAETVLLTLQNATLIDNSITGAFTLSTSGTTFTLIQNSPLVAPGGNLNISSNTQITNLTSTYNPAGFIFTNTPVVTNLNVAGIAGALTTIQGNINSNSTYLKDIPYVSLLNASTTGGAGWYLGYTAVDNGGSTGWHFINSSAFSGMSFF